MDTNAKDHSPVPVPDTASAPLDDGALLSLWQRVLSLRNREPYCYSSERYSHRDAADAVAEQDGLVGDALKSWREYVNRRTAGMSNYAGD